MNRPNITANATKKGRTAKTASVSFGETIVRKITLPIMITNCLTISAIVVVNVS
ncbi:hypothetical protein GCM10022210_38010 [Mucilaginibacter dorajii]|uniref:Uncharacterized protein n=1 Tax=Mucilaginibacter dorajii TaxID=692994 RepID=A0ABP7QI19_9SPHI